MRAIDQVKSLNRLVRTGWERRGVREPETVGEHTAECVAMALEFGEKLGVDPERLAEMLAVHDWPESDPDVGDITIHCGVTAEDKFAREKAAMERLCARLPDGEAFLELWLAFEARACAESRVARQIDKLQMAYKAVVYHVEQGFDPGEFLADADGSVKHPVLRDILARLSEVVRMPE